MDSLHLAQSGQRDEALRLVDELIAEAITEGDEMWVFTLINHAGIVGGYGIGGIDRTLKKRYYERYLGNFAENPRALYALADEAVRDGQIELAREYAARCYRALLQSTDERSIKDLFDLVLERWPEVSATKGTA